MFEVHVTMETTCRRKVFRKAALAVFACLVAVGLAGTASRADAAPSNDKQAEASAVKAELDNWQSTLDQASDDYNQALMDHDAAVAGMAESQAKIDEAEAKKASLQSHLSTRARSMYRSGSSTFLDVLLGATSFDDFITTWDTLNDLNAEDESYVAEARQAQAEAQAAHDEYARQEQTANDSLAQAEAAKAQAEATTAQYQAKLDSLDSETATLVAQQQAADLGITDDGDGGAAVAAGGGGGGGAATTGGGSASSGSSSSGSSSSSSSRSSSGGSSSSSSSSGSSGGATYDGGGDVVSRAYACIGAPYEWGAVGPESYDCSGLVSYCITGRHTRAFTSASLMGYPAVSDPQPGDVCVKSGHCGIYIGGGKMIHAPQTGYTVCVTNVQRGMKIVRP